MNTFVFQDSKNRVYFETNEKEDGAFSHVDITISLKRRTLFYTFNYVIPSFMLTILSISGFILPAESGEKIGLRKLKNASYKLLQKNSQFLSTHK